MASNHRNIEPTIKILTVGVNIIYYPGEFTTTTADITTATPLINSTISTPDATFLCADISNFYINTPTDRYEYTQLPFDIIPQEIIDEYNLNDIAHNVKVYIDIL